jgi:hypothetical protein
MGGSGGAAMSTDWNVFCLDRGDTHYFGDANHQEDVMVLLCKHATAIGALAPLLDSVDFGLEFTTPWGRIDASWFARHATHRLAPISEYGDILDSCQERISCECGSNNRRCALDPGHAGEHQAVRR